VKSKVDKAVKVMDMLRNKVYIDYSRYVKFRKLLVRV
jgi:hypothetical protein